MKLEHFDLNLLRTLDILLEERNVTRAAQRLCVTQQAASGALQRLRRYFHDDLLTRLGRAMELTPLAAALRSPVREALLAAQTAIDTRPDFDPGETRATFRIAMSDYALFVLLPLILQQLGEEAPHARCLVETIRQDCSRRLVSGDLDFHLSVDDLSIRSRNDAISGIRSTPMFEDDFVCVVDPTRIDPIRGITPEDYQRHRHNLVAFGEGVVTLVEAGWRAAGLAVDVAAAAPSFSALIFMLPGTSLIATAQRRLATVLAPRLGLAVVECPVALPQLEEHLTWHARSERDPAHRYFRAVITQAAARLRRRSTNTTI